MTSRTGGPGCAELRRGAAAGLLLALAFTAGAASGGDNAAWVSYSGVPKALEPNETATVTVKMKNTGTTTWKTTVVTETKGSTLTTTRTSYSLDAVGHGWGVNGVAVTGSVAPNATRSFQFTITAPGTAGNYTFQWRMSRTTVVTDRPIVASSTPGTSFGAATPSRTIHVGSDTAPSFGNRTIDDQEWLRGKAIDAVTLPAATGGNGPLSYSLSGCYLPGGVTLDPATRQLSGTPRTAWGPTTCTWKVTDADDNTAASDADTLTFKITVKRPILTVSPAELTVEEGKTGTFTVEPSEQPTGTVTVTVSSADIKVATVSPASLTFNATTYAAKTVTVTGEQDEDASDEEDTSVSLSASGGGYNNVSATVTVKVKDDDEPDLVVKPASLTNPPIDEGGSRTFDVKLATQPTHEVTVSVSSGDTEAAGVSPASLSFTTDNYGAWQTVTVTGEQDADAAEEEVTVSLSASGGDYNNVSATVTVKVKDDDVKGVVVKPASLTNPPIDEGDSRTFTVKLATQPTHDVTVSVSSGDTDAADVDLTSLSFTTDDYGTPQTVTVTGVQDADAENEEVTVSLSASGGDYADESATVTVKVKDDDVKGVVVDPTDLTVKEGSNGTFDVRLATQPTGAVTVTVTSGDTGAAGVSPASLSFSTGNYSSPQAVTVTGKQDADASDEETSIALSASGGGYNNVSASVDVNVDDDDTRDLVLSATDLGVGEGGNGTFTVALATQPRGPVTVTVTSGDTGAAGVSPASLSFGTGNYSSPQTVTVTGKQDADASDEGTSIVLAASGGDYGSVSSSVSVTVTDDDTEGLALSATDLSIAEDGNGTFTVALATQPTGTVTVSVTSGATGAATVSPASLSFTAADYGTSQTVTVTGVQDGDAANETTTVSLAASGGDYGSVSSSVSVTVTDDDTQGLALSATDLSVAEGGNGTFTVALSTQPTDTVTVAVSSGDTGAATVSPASLSFTAADYGTLQTVTVTGVQDADASDQNTGITLAASGGDYGSVSSSVSVTVTDDDTPDLVLSATDLGVGEGGNGTFTVALATQPTGAVTVTVTSGATGAATVSPASLSFTAADYGTLQTVTVTGVQDDDAANETTTVSLAASGGGYGNVSSSVSVTVTDDDTQGLALSATDLSVAEGGNGTFTVALSTQPTGTVTVAVSSGDTAAATVSPASLSFTAADYGTSQTVTVTGVQDDDADNESTSISLSASGGDYGNVSSSVSVTVTDDDSETPSVPAGTPSFGAATILDQTWVKNVAISSLTLPAATGGDGDLTYALAGALPAGVTFDASTRTLSGTPTKKQAATAYTYTATDEDADATSLSFTIRVAGKASDDASFVSYAGVPSTMAAGSSTTVTVRMRNDGTTTWTSSAGYELGSQRPQDNVTWGLSRVSLPSDAAPNATAGFTFTITAPTELGSHNFRWRMVLAADGWFGDKTELRAITVEADESPSFGTSTILDRTWVKNAAISSLTLPAATGGNGDLTYALAGALPAGVTFDASTRTLSGTPTKKQAATQYTYTATDLDGDAVSLTFTIEVAGKASDDASFVSYAGVPSTMAAGSSATVTVRMRNAGATTWTSSADYQLGSQRPQDNVRWGLSRVSLPSDVAPNATADFTFTITAPTELGSHNFRWRMLRGAGDWFGDKTELRAIEVEADESPSFGTSTILDRTWVKNTAIAALTLPAATGGNGDLTYALTGALPAGVTFDASTRTLSGTPTAKQEAVEYTYTATDTDGDAASLSFTIRVAGKASDDASFVSYADVPSRMAAGSSATVTVRMRNEGTTTWTSSADYQLGSQRPQDNVRWGLSRVSLPSDVAPNATADFTFTITAPTELGSHNFRWRMLRGAGDWFGDKTELRTITVEDPSFGDATIPDQAWVKDTPIDALTLPAASGGGGALTYSLTPALPAGVTFTESTRLVSGTPTTVQAKTAYTYTATDTYGDAATISFEIGVAAAPVDDAVFLSSSGVPSKIVAGGTATVTVTMRNTGTTTWTSSADYELGSQSPSDNDTWGLSRVSVPSDVAPNATAAFTFTITAPETTGSYVFAWRMVRDAAWFGAGTGSVTITVEDPSFGDATIADQTWVRDAAIEAMTLPAASGGDGALTYGLTPSLPDGVSFTASTRTLSGTPTALQAATRYEYTATDTNGDAATLSFEIGVVAATTDDAAFVSSSGVPSKMLAGGTATVIVTMRNTGTTTWTSSADYELGSQSPSDNATWGLSRVSVPSDVAPNAAAAFTFTITAPDTPGSYTFAWRMVRDAAWFGAGTGSVTIAVEDPSFGDTTVADQTWLKDTAIHALTLPAASGGEGTLTYSLTPSPPAGVTFTASTRTLSGTPTAVQARTDYAYAATDANGYAATLSFAITVNQAAASLSSAASALPPPAPTGVFDMFEYWLLPGGSTVKLRARLGDGRIAPAAGSSWMRSFWRGDLWGRKVALLGDPRGERYDIFEETEDGLDYWGTFEGAAAGGEARPSLSLDGPFRWMNRFMAVGDVVENPVTGRLLSSSRRNQESVLETTMRLEVVAHRASFTIPVAGGVTFEDVLEVRFWSDVEQAEAHDTFFLAPGYGAVYSRRSAVAAAGGVVEWWAVEKALTPVVPSAPSVPWFDPFSPGWPKTAVLNGNLDDLAHGVEGGRIGTSEVPGWTADSGDAVIARPPSGLEAGPRAMLLRGSDGGGDGAPDVAITEDWIPVEGGTYRLSACMWRENAGDNVLVDFDDGKGRDADFADAHLVAASTGSWECRAVTKCIPASVGAVRIRAVRDGANLGDAWFDRIELKRIASCTEEPAISPP